MDFTKEESNYNTYKRKSIKREKWRIYVEELDVTDLPEISHVTSELKNCNNEKEEMQKLNNRLSDYIKKVQHLEDRNKTLENDLSRQKGSASVGEIYKKDMKSLRTSLEEREKMISKLSLELEQLKVKYQNESAIRKKAEDTLEKFRTVERTSTTKYNEMNIHVDTLVRELEFQEKVIKELGELQMPSELVKEMSELKQTFEKKETEYKILLESKKTEAESLQKTNGDLNKKQQKYKVQIEKLESDVSTTKAAMKVQISEYQELLNVKIKLDKEIEQYRILLEGGEKDIKNYRPPESPEAPKMGVPDLKKKPPSST